MESPFTTAAEHAEPNIPQLDLPIPGDTANLKVGPRLNDACLPLEPLIGVWRGEGEVDYPTIAGPYRFRQQVTISHDGRPFLLHEARSWLVDAEGEVIRPAARETGWWRPQPGEATELLLTHSTGILELFYGKASGRNSWELSTDTVLLSASAKRVEAAQRRYDIAEDGSLHYAEKRAMVGQPMTPHVSARLHRVIG